MRYFLLAAVLLASPASAFTAQNGLIVRPAGQADFTVGWRGMSDVSQFWCAAGDYGIRVLKLSPAVKIYRASEPPRRAGEGIRFTLDPAQAASSTGIAFFWPKGAAVTAGFAQSFCEERRR